jgi:hypothetical protein
MPSLLSPSHHPPSVPSSLYFPFQKQIHIHQSHPPFSLYLFLYPNQTKEKEEEEEEEEEEERKKKKKNK